jgi:hypothetical protein
MRQARLEALAAVGGEARPVLRAGDDVGQLGKHLAAVAHAQAEGVGRPKKAWNWSASTGLKVMLRAQPMPAPSVSP